MSPAIYYHPDGYDTSRDRLMGRHSAGEAFLKAMVRHAPKPFGAYAKNSEHYKKFLKQITELGGSEKDVTWVPLRKPEVLEDFGTLYYPGPDLEKFAWHRESVGSTSHSLCGITHTTASARAQSFIRSWLSAPLYSWDAVVCTSPAVKAMVLKVLEEEAEHLKDRLGMKTPIIPELPVIPLGVHCPDFEPTDEARANGKKIRRELKVEDDALMVLYLGRLAFHAKAHPFAMYVALNEAAKRTKKKIHLVLAGWTANDYAREEFIRTARAFCGHITVHMVDGRKPAVRRYIWHAADIFTSLSDNIQETFGLTPVEAMAAGLPSVLSDWNGYRDTVRDGKEGLMVPTWLPPAGAAHDVTQDYLLESIDYDSFVGMISQFAAVDIRAAADAYATLISDEDKRKAMGAAGVKRARELFDWEVILRQYEALWADLAKRRKAGRHTTSQKLAKPKGRVQPRRDVLAAFEHYATHLMAPKTKVALEPGMDLEELKHRARPGMNRVAAPYLTRDDYLKDVIDRLDKASAKKPETVESLIGDVPDEAVGARRLRTLAWLAKIGVIRLEN